MERPAKTVLPNGLTVVLRRVEYAPVAACVLSYRVGSRNEREGVRGLSHFLEHMMFKGTDRMPPSRYWQLIKRAGGVANAFTSRDMTAYYTVVPDRSLERVLRIESDRMRNCTMEADEVAAERQVVLEELRMTGRDNPTGMLMDRLYAEAFPRHPYRWPVAGTAEDVEEFTRAKVLHYYGELYRPENAVLSICGCIDGDRTQRLCGEIFGGSEDAVSALPSRIAPDPRPRGRRELDLEHPSMLRRLALGFRVPAGDHPDAALLKMLALRLAAGRTGILESSLIETGLAVGVSASSLGGIDPGLFVVAATLAPGVEHSEATEVVESGIADLASKPLSTEEMESLATRLRADALFASSNPAGRAIQLGMDVTRFDRVDRTDMLLETASGATSEDLMRAAAEYLSPDRAVLVRMEPAAGGGVLSPSAEVPSEAPPGDVREPESIDLRGLQVPDRLLALPRRSISRGAVERVLGCGARAVVIEDHSFPTAAMSFSFPMASDAEPPEMAGLCSVTAESMMRGTESLGYRQLHAVLEDRGGSLDLGAGREFSRGMATFLPSMTDEVLRTVADVLLNPAFRDEDVERVTAEKEAEIRRKHESPFGLAADNLSLLMCRPPEMARIPTPQTLDRMGSGDVREWHRLCCRPEGAIFVAVGDLDADAVLDCLDGLLDGWRGPSEPLPERRLGSLPETALSRSQHMEGMEQAAVLLGLEAPDRYSGQRDAMGLISWLLGGGIGSRLGHRVRDREGLAYAVGSAYLPWPGCGRLILYLSTSGTSAGRAMTLVKEELERMTSEPVTETELRLACAYRVGRHSLERMDYGSVAEYILVHLARGRGLEYDLESLRRTLSITPEDLLDASRRWLGPDRPLFVSRAGNVPQEMGE
ncbi:MAG: M16 family metallopeptidase [Candidatus Fermentibacterota bacterium]